MSKNSTIPSDFKRILLVTTAPGLPWDCSCADDRQKPFVDLAEGACNVDNGSTKFPVGVAAPLATNTPISVTYLGQSQSDDGCRFHAFLFRGPGYEVVSWVEDDGPRARSIWRGDEKSYEQASLTLRLSDHAAKDLVS